MCTDSSGREASGGIALHPEAAPVAATSRYDRVVSASGSPDTAGSVTPSRRRPALKDQHLWGSQVTAQGSH